MSQETCHYDNRLPYHRWFKVPYDGKGFFFYCQTCMDRHRRKTQESKGVLNG